MNGSCHISRIKYWIIPILDLPLQYLAIISAAKSSPRLDQLHKNQGGGKVPEGGGLFSHDSKIQS